MRPSATGRPARTAPRSPRALVPVDAATQAPGPGLSPRAALPASRRSHGALSPGTPSDPTVWGSWGLCRNGWAARASQRPARAPHPHGAASASAARRYPCARPRPQPPGNATCSPQVPRPAEGPASGTRTPLLTRPPQLGLQGAPSPGTPTDPTVWGAQGHCRPPARPPAPPPRPPRALHPHGAASASAARRYPCA